MDFFQMRVGTSLSGEKASAGHLQAYIYLLELGWPQNSKLEQSKESRGDGMPAMEVC